LAVDVEPTVFWNGNPADYPEMLAAWRAETGFLEGDGAGTHGWISDVPPPANGSSGFKVEARYLRPLGIAADTAAFTDVYPVFVTKSTGRGPGGRREQGDAIRDEYDAIADAMGRSPSSLPSRPTARLLVKGALERSRPSRGVKTRRRGAFVDHSRRRRRRFRGARRRVQRGRV
jgi:hypothetical protein